MSLSDVVPEKMGDKPYFANKIVRDMVAGAIAAPMRVAPTHEWIGGIFISRNLYANRIHDILGGFPSLNLALSFAFKENYKSFFLERVDKNDRLKFFNGNFLSGACSGFTATCFSYPIERFARFAMLDAPTSVVTPHASSVVHSETSIPGLFGYLNNSLDTLNKGFFGKLQLTMIHRGLYFGLYDTFKLINSDWQTSTKFVLNFYVALGTTAAAELITYPFYFVIMRPPGRQEERMAIQYFKDSTTKGNKNLSRGFVTRTISGALALILFDGMQKLLH